VPDLQLRAGDPGILLFARAVLLRLLVSEASTSPFPVRECTHYEDKRLASKKEMEEIAWFLTTRKSGRSVGFVSAEKFQELEAAEGAATKNKSTEPKE
jgi:hypothetical protein